MEIKNPLAPMTKEERDAAEADRAATAAAGSATARAKKNRANGKPQPVSGTRLLVRALQGMRNRRRCRIDFEPGSSLELDVVDLTRVECEALRATGRPVVSEDEAEQILADDRLVAIPLGAGVELPPDEDVARATASVKAAAERATKAEGENEELKKRLAKLESDLAAMKPSDGRPERNTKAPKDEPKG